MRNAGEKFADTGSTANYDKHLGPCQPGRCHGNPWLPMMFNTMVLCATILGEKVVSNEPNGF
jgi:hypothetical protein